ncbi:MAG TPA: glucose 1-dehydrogenase [Paraburkholderia sp.]|uniref:glucose 1-dehydrogenase n=1 Tax=Paraburkholderia sp. TaxID=1926495 RepID=UPI002B49F3DA|nr:glucose 1-dehydrogenase [Paraburkholderia sp.]HKR45825.1 glucose 1-dehydrogenase [Paraburkholderia sp.]
MGRVSGKTALVTGAARGLGAAFARRLIAEGASVLLCDVLDEAGEALAHELGERARFVHHDVTRAQAWEQSVALAEAEFGPVNVLVNNAGVLGVVAPIEQLSEEDVRNVISVNQIGTFLGMQAVLPSMRRAGGGSIINVSSTSGLRGVPCTLAYTASKFAVRGMTKVAALELAQYGIRVNSLHPGPFRTHMTAGDSDSLQQILSVVPAGRVGEPDELSHMMLLLASDDMRFATGAEYVVDGGLTCR